MTDGMDGSVKKSWQINRKQHQKTLSKCLQQVPYKEGLERDVGLFQPLQKHLKVNLEMKLLYPAAFWLT